MDEKAIKRRNWVKNIAIIFLAVMLVLTLFSNTIMNFSLPEVSAQYCYSGTITTRIRGSGTIEAKETYAVTAASTSTIKDIGIKVGSRVEIGDVMFLLEDEGDANIITALEDLAKLRP
jgi:multidrug efflux pump subunit AcrA (membrane-fusion protein)